MAREAGWRSPGPRMDQEKRTDLFSRSAREHRASRPKLRPIRPRRGWTPVRSGWPRRIQRLQCLGAGWGDYTGEARSVAFLFPGFPDSRPCMEVHPVIPSCSPPKARGDKLRRESTHTRKIHAGAGLDSRQKSAGMTRGVYHNIYVIPVKAHMRQPKHLRRSSPGSHAPAWEPMRGRSCVLFASLPLRMPTRGTGRGSVLTRVPTRERGNEADGRVRA